MTSGRAVTATASRIADDFITRVRDANRPAYRSRSRLAECISRSGWLRAPVRAGPRDPPCSASVVLYRHPTSERTDLRSRHQPVLRHRPVQARECDRRAPLPPGRPGRRARRSRRGPRLRRHRLRVPRVPAFLVAVFALAILAYAVDRLGGRASRRRRGRARDAGRTPRPGGASAGSSRRDPVAPGFAAVAAALGALLFAGSLAAGHEEAWPGPRGSGGAALGAIAVSGLLGA